jgi:PmbA protein
MADDHDTDLLCDLIAAAKKAGADGADAVYARGQSQSVSQRLGIPEAVERSEENDIGLRVFIGRQQACVSSSDVSPAALTGLAERAVAMAKVAPEDPYARLATAAEVIQNPPLLEIYDPTEPEAAHLRDRAAAAEDAARAVDGVTNSEGAEAGWGLTDVTIAASNGFLGRYQRSSHYISASVLAGSGQEMERDYDYDAKVFLSDLGDAAIIGQNAGQRAVQRLGAKSPKTGSMPVVFDKRASASLLRHFASAVNGSAIARGTSFLKDALGSAVFAAGINVIDDPHRARGFKTRPFDAEGIATKHSSIVTDGTLQSWFLDLATAAQLESQTTGHASRGVGGPPSPSASNLYIAAGDQSFADMIADIKEGILVNELMGMSISIVTGDYSRGAAGYWIENGQITHPISEATIAGNLKDMFAQMTAANDLEFKYGIDAPSLRVDGMTVAGSS